MMTEEKVYSVGRDGTYCLGFPNKFALSEHEIREIFSNYGNVLSVRTSGDERGFRFVRYKKLEEAERAVEALKVNKKIRLLPKRSKVQDGPNKGPAKENLQKKEKQTIQGSSIKRTQLKKNSADENWDNFDQLEETPPFSPFKQGNSMKNDIPAVSNLKSFLNNKKLDVNSTRDTYASKKIAELRVSRGIIANNFDSKYNHIPDEHKLSTHQDSLPDLRMSHLNGVGFQGIDNASLFSNTNVSQSKNGTTRVQDGSEMPELFNPEDCKQKSLKGSVCGDETAKTILAKEVIVANIHEDFSELYILFLFENYEPICVTEMRTIAQQGIRYCIVYFKTSEEAIAVEKKFNSLNLLGKKLIVRTSDLLIREFTG